MVEAMVDVLLMWRVRMSGAGAAQGALGLQHDGAVDHAAVELGGAG